MFSFARRGSDTSAWTADQWRAHLLKQALSESERQEIYALFSRQ